jgi:hypothetical protein
MASVTTRSYSAALHCSILLTALISNAGCPKGKRPQSGGGKRAGAVVSWTSCGGMRPAYAISDHTRPNSVCTVPDYKPEKSPLSTAWNGTAGLMFEHILRSAPTPKKERRHGPRKTRRREPAGCIYSAVLQANFQRRERASARSSETETFRDERKADRWFKHQRGHAQPVSTEADHHVSPYI